MAEQHLMSSRGRVVKLAPWASGAGNGGQMTFRPMLQNSVHRAPPVFQELPDEGTDSDRTASPEPSPERVQRAPPRRQSNPTPMSKRGSVPVRDETGKFIGVRPKTAAERAQVGNTGGIFKNAAIEVLRQELKLMSTGDIARTAIEKNIIKCQGKTPEATMASALYTDVKRKEFNSIFIRPHEGLFGLREWITNGTPFEGMEEAGYGFQAAGHPLVPLPQRQPISAKRPFETYAVAQYYNGQPGQPVYMQLPPGGVMMPPGYLPPGAAYPNMQGAQAVPAGSMPQGYAPPGYVLAPQGAVPQGQDKRRRTTAPPAALRPATGQAGAATPSGAVAVPGQPGATTGEQGNIMLLIDAAEELSSQDSLGSADNGVDGPQGMEGSSLGPRGTRRTRTNKSRGSGQPTDARKVIAKAAQRTAKPFVPDVSSLSITGLGLEAARLQQPTLLPGQAPVAPADANIINMPLPETDLIDTTPLEEWHPPVEEPLEASPATPSGPPDGDALLISNAAIPALAAPALLNTPSNTPAGGAAAPQGSQGAGPSGESGSVGTNPLGAAGGPVGAGMDLEGVQLMETNTELLEKTLGKKDPQVGKAWLFLARVYSSVGSPAYNPLKGQEALQKAKDVILACGGQQALTASETSFAYLLQKPATPDASAQAKPAADTSQA